MSEAAEQVALMKWAATRLSVMPELAYLFAVPNGELRAKSVAMRLKAQGVRPGVPDLCLPVARNGLGGLWIEMKVRPNKPTENQERWLAFLRTQGYATEVAYGWQSAAAVIEAYLGLPPNQRTEFYGD